MSYHSHEGANRRKGSAATHRTGSSTQQVHRQARREGTPVLQVTKKTEVFQWTREAKDPFQALKQTLSTSHVLVAPQEKDG